MRKAKKVIILILVSLLFNSCASSNEINKMFINHAESFSSEVYMKLNVSNSRYWLDSTIVILGDPLNGDYCEINILEKGKISNLKENLYKLEPKTIKLSIDVNENIDSKTLYDFIYWIAYSDYEREDNKIEYETTRCLKHLKYIEEDEFDSFMSGSEIMINYLDNFDLLSIENRESKFSFIEI